MLATIKTGAPLSEELFHKMIGSKNFGNAHHYVRQIGLGTIDMFLHCHYHPSMDIFSEYQKILEEIYQKPSDGFSDKMLTSFSHIFAGGYAAGYYSYLWARIFSADAFALFEEQGVDDLVKRKEMGMRFRNTVLALGGSVSPDEVYYQFRGRKKNGYA